VLACATLTAGAVVGQRLSWTAYHRGRAVLVAEEISSVTDEIPGWQDASEGQFVVRVRVDGDPPLRMDLAVGNEPVPGLPTSGGQLAVAMTALPALPDVLRARRGSHRACVRSLPMARVTAPYPTTEAVGRNSFPAALWRRLAYLFIYRADAPFGHGRGLDDRPVPQGRQARI